jgi:tripartite-type tricarboxylate transporter receptor subunit TctC
MADTVAGYEASAVTGIGVPKGTPPEIIFTLSKAINAAFEDSAMKQRLADTGGDILPGTPIEFGKLLAAETEKWGKVVRFANIKAN